MRVQGVFYRGHDPKWSFLPLSGDGAAVHGGRWNPKGVPALYLSKTRDTVHLEMTQGFSERMKPLMLVQYYVDCEDITDLTQERARRDLGITLEDMGGAWKPLSGVATISFTWNLAASLIANGSAGILVPSFAPGATQEDINLVLWDWSVDLPHQVIAYDPDGALPTNQKSWETDEKE